MAENNEPKRGLASKGIEFYPNYTGESAQSIWYLTQIGEIKSGERDKLDATCMRDDFVHNVDGIRQELDNYEINFLYNTEDENSDYRTLAKLEDENKVVPIMVKMPDGSKFTNSATVTVSIDSVGVNDLVKAKGTFALKGEWAKTFPSV